MPTPRRPSLPLPLLALLVAASCAAPDAGGTASAGGDAPAAVAAVDDTAPISRPRSDLVTLRGAPVTLVGDPTALVAVGRPAPDATLVANDLSERALSEWRGKVAIVSTVPSLDTKVCDLETRTFNERAATLPGDVVVLTLSNDLPFAQARWCGNAGIERVTTLSDARRGEVGARWGLRIEQSGLLARAVFVLDREGVVRYAQVVDELTHEPDYDAALAAARALAGGDAAPAAEAATPRAGDAAASRGPGWTFDAWEKLPTEAYPGKQDDIVFVSPDVGFYGNGKGKVFRSVDGGRSWTQVLDQPGTYVRCLGFLDARRGFLGNVGTDYFPGVTDETPLWRTDDGGDTWTPVSGIDAPGLKGLCAIQVLRWPFIDAGVPGTKTFIVAGGRVGGPAWLLLSDDLGESWRTIDMSPWCGMILDVRFFTDRIGLVAAATSSDAAESHALILRTEDGGANWTPVYDSGRPFELTWKMDFPTRDVGYCTVQSYDPAPLNVRRVVATTEDGGRTWRELHLVDDHAVREFGVGFLDARTGFVGAMPHGFVTRDGGASWEPTDFGNAVNKIRVLPIDADGDGRPEAARAYAIGVEVHRLDATRDG